MALSTSQYAFYRPEYVPDLFALRNNGVICWCNSLIQALLSCSPMNQTLLAITSPNDNQFMAEYTHLLNCVLPNVPECPKINPLAYTEASTKVATAFAKQLAATGKTLTFSSQECTDEALVLFLEMFTCPRVERLFQNSYETQLVCPNCKRSVPAPRDTNVRIEMFSRIPLTKQAEFEDYIRVHPSMVDTYTCESCGTATKQVLRIEKLKMLREIIVLVFNKFYNKALIWYPEELTFPATSGKTLKYQLVATIEHTGTRYGGHYYANVRRGENVWRANDSSIYKIDKFEPSPETFMLFYCLVGEV